MTQCVKCKSSETRKHGFGRNATQMFFCKQCHSSFTGDGVRGTYSPEFKESVVESYCHQRHTAQDVTEKYGISTRTLVKWKKEHQTHCDCGEK